MVRHKLSEGQKIDFRPGEMPQCLYYWNLHAQNYDCINVRSPRARLRVEPFSRLSLC